MAFETMAVLLAVHLEMWDISHVDDGEDPQKAKTTLKAKGRRSEPSDPDHLMLSEITLEKRGCRNPENGLPPTPMI